MTKSLSIIFFLFIYTSLTGQNIHENNDTIPLSGIISYEGIDSNNLNGNNYEFTWYILNNSWNEQFTKPIIDLYVKKFNLEKFYQVNLVDGFDGAKKIFEDKNGNLWFLSKNNSLAKYNGNEFEIFNKKYLDFCINNNGIWGLTNDGIIKYDINSWVLVKRINPSLYSPNKMYSDSKENLWIFSKQIYRFNGIDWFEYNEKDGFSKYLGQLWVSTLLEFNEKIYFGTIRGINVYSEGDFQRLDKDYGLSRLEYLLIHSNDKKLYAFPRIGVRITELITIENNNIKIYNKKNTNGLFPLKGNYSFIISDSTNELVISNDGKFYALVEDIFQETIEINDSMKLMPKVKLIHPSTEAYLSHFDYPLYCYDAGGVRWTILTDSSSCYLISNKGQKLLISQGKDAPPKPQFIYCNSLNEIWIGFSIPNSNSLIGSYVIKIKFSS